MDMVKTKRDWEDGVEFKQEEAMTYLLVLYLLTDLVRIIHQ